MNTKINSINAKLILLISAILFGTILVILFSTNWILIRFQRNTVDQALQRTELLVNTLITTKLTELKVQSQLVGELPILNTVVENGEINTIKDVGKTYRDNLGVSIFDIMGRDGKLLASIGGNFLPDDTLAGTLAKRVLEEGGLSTIYPRGGRLILVAGAPIGTSEDAAGVLIIGAELDSAFAGRIRDFTKSEISFVRTGHIGGSSLSGKERAHLESVFAKEIEPLQTGDKAGYKEMGAYAVRNVALKDKNAASLGTAVILMPLAEHRKMLSILKFSLIGIASVVFGIAWFISYRFATSFTRPIADAVRFAQKLASGDRNTPIEINRSDELGNLQESLEKMRVALRELIDNLDAKVKDAIKHVTNILDNLDSGFLMFDSKGVVQPGYSRISEEYFGGRLAGKKVEEILAIEASIWPSIEGWRSIMFEGILPFKDSCQLGPGSFEKLQGRYIELSYRPILAGDKLEGVILIATDKTRERELFRKFESEKERVNLIMKIMANRDAFLDFVKDSHKMINDLQENLETKRADLDVEGAFRTVHTLKGNSAMYDCTTVREIAHTLESDLSTFRDKEPGQVEQYLPTLRAGLVGLQESLLKIVEDNKGLLGDMTADTEELRRVTVSVKMLSELEQALLQNFNRESLVYRMFLDSLVLEPIVPMLRKYEAVAKDLAERRDKMIKPIIWEGEDIKVRLPAYKRLLAALIHAFRNAVDHGIESPDDRESAGKDPMGQLWVTADWIAGEEPKLRIRIKDDGKGIDADIIRRKIVEKNLIDEATASNLDDEAVIQFVFKNGFSTADAVTDISGRGVGMDAIAYEARKLEGTAWIKSKIGVGSELFVEVPIIA